MTELLASTLLSTLLLWFVTALICAGIYSSLRPRLYAVDPNQAGNYLLVLLSLPALCALGTALLLYLPDVSRQLVSAHCHAGDCGGHGPRLHHAALPAAALLLWYAARVTNTARRHWSTGRYLARQLRVTGVQRRGIVELGAARPAAFTLGWWQPTIYLSRGLLEQCSELDVACILAHERAHKQRRDNLRLLVAMVLTAPLPRRLTRGQLEDLQLLHELAADRSAARDCGPEAVAAALLRVARLQNMPYPQACAAFTGSKTLFRVEVLLQEPPARLPGLWSLALAAGVLLGVIALINPLHVLIESLASLS
jgi:Zn-dependent protease with chaperone function